jgi:hypothetical protein
MVNKTDIRQDMNRGQIPAITCSQVPELPTITLTTFFNVHLSHYSNFQHSAGDLDAVGFGLFIAEFGSRPENFDRIRAHSRAEKPGRKFFFYEKC